MLKDITLGQFFPGNSILHRLDPRTKIIIAVFFIASIFVAKNPAGAFAWFARSAEQNLDIAQYNLGIMYLKGVYVEKNRDEAKRYFALAAANGHEEAEKILAKLK